MRALDGVTILDLTHMLSGPYAGMVLADLGARCIKVEPPGRGEGTRRLLETSPDYARAGMGAYFMTLNRNKESVALDLKHPDGLALFYALVAKADVVLNNFAAGVPKRLKIDYDTLAQHNPRIITCSITGFGETGPGLGRVAFDLVAQGMGGGMALTGHPGADPLRSGIPIGDLGGGLFGVVGVLAALQARTQTGRGQHVDISMLDGQVSLLNYMATMFLMSGKPPERAGNGHFVHVPYNTFRTQTRYLIVAVLTDEIWRRLADLLDDPALAAPVYDTQPGRLAHKTDLEARVQTILERQTCEHWLAALEVRRIPCAPVNDFEHVFTDPQVIARSMTVDVPLPDGSTVRQPGNPVKLSQTFEDTYAPPPQLGQHTAAVLHSLLGLEDAEIARHAASGALGLSDLATPEP